MPDLIGIIVRVPDEALKMLCPAVKLKKYYRLEKKICTAADKKGLHPSFRNGLTDRVLFDIMGDAPLGVEVPTPFTELRAAYHAVLSHAYDQHCTRVFRGYHDPGNRYRDVGGADGFFWHMPFEDAYTETDVLTSLNRRLHVLYGKKASVDVTVGGRIGGH